MKTKITFFIGLLIILPFISCNPKQEISDMNIIYLHHSTGALIWQGGQLSLFTRAVRKVSPGIAKLITRKNKIPKLMKQYNKINNKHYTIQEMAFPKESPYGWQNYPYDYYNIWVKNAGPEPFMEEPTLEILTKKYQVIIFKHCFPVSGIQPDKEVADINSDYKSLANYKLQYNAIRDKLHEFPDTKFILFTGAALVKGSGTEEEALRTKEFFTWVINEWDLPDDNIYIWDLYSLETEGGLYLKDEYATSPRDSHPNDKLASKAAELIFNRIIDVIDNDGKNTKLTGEKTSL
jgi:hypothetical protein